MTPDSHPELTAERLRELLSYDPAVGEFRRKVSPNSRIKPGDIAGFVGTAGYVQIKADGRNYLAHRLAWLYVHGVWPADQIDHINGIRSDNRIENLREATSAQNQQNRSLCHNSKSGYPGVRWAERRRKWQAVIKTGGRTTHLGSFTNIEDAIAARAKAKAESHAFQPFDRQSAPQPKTEDTK